jgi:2,3-bisphosphoglycerate-dependent phosphoglycerate mutase
MRDTASVPTSVTTILLIRHGETAWNATRRLQGHSDIALNGEGRRQALALGLALRDTRLDAIVASDLQRARQTAQAVADHHGLPVQQDGALRERCYGGFEGLHYAEIEQRYPLQYAAWQARDVDALMPPGARVPESFRHFYQRCVGAILGLARQHPGQTLALVAHGGVLECAYRSAMKMALDSPRNFPVKNASINRFTVSRGVLALTAWGDCAHLNERALDELT